MPYFFYQALFSGRMVPVKSMSNPYDQKAENATRSTVQDVTLITEEEYKNKALVDLVQKYPMTEKSQ